jgi:uncharacterized protein YndB with AHSA1/START domain
MVRTMLVVFAAALGVLLLLAAFRPDSFRIERSVAIAAPPEKVYAQLADFRAWSRWSPWEKKDPALRRNFSGAPQGVGAAYAWESDKVGHGRMEIAEARVATDVRIKIDFVKPFEAHNVVDFTLRPQGGKTVVRWAMHGPNTYLGKLMGIFMDMDRVIGRDFEDGLAALKTVAEG